MGTREKIGFGGLGVDLMSGAALAWVGHQWLWVPFALGLLMAIWGLWPRAKAIEASSPSNSGAFAGRDNTGTQQVFHGPVTVNHAPSRGGDVNINGGIGGVSFNGGTAGLTIKGGDGAAKPSEFEPLREASRRVLEANIGNMITEFAMHEKTPDERLNWGAIWLADVNAVPIYGKRPPLEVYEQIPTNDIKRFFFRNGATQLGEVIGQRPVVWHDLAVKPEDLANRWDEICRPR